MHNDLEKLLTQYQLSYEEYNHIQKSLKRVPNFLELEILGALLSEHCSYKSSKIFLETLFSPTKEVIQGPGENAGIVDITKGYGAVFKIESHNHPSFIEPVAGSATAIGGIMRDIFAMGARLVANLNFLRFGKARPKISAYQRHLIEGVAQGISSYSNCMGVPTLNGETNFNACYENNILVNAFCLGIVKKEKIFYSQAIGEGNAIIYVGSKTGTDGILGALMSSNRFDEDSKNAHLSIQIGDPFSEKLLLEACLESFDKNLIIGIQDMGAAGLANASFEMALKGKSGIELHLDNVPTTKKLTPLEIMLSESQERMLLCVSKDKIKEILEIFKKWDLEACVIGHVIKEPNIKLFYHNQLLANMPTQCLNIPPLKRPFKEPPYYQELKNKPSFTLPNISLQKIYETLLSAIEVVDKRAIYEQYDDTILLNTILGNGNCDASIIQVEENGVKLSISIGCLEDLCYLDPKEGAKLTLAKVARDGVLRGARILGISDCLNFGNPNDLEVMWQFKESIEGLKEACEILKTPIVSGNVSFYNQTLNHNIYPTPSIVAVGLIKHDYPISSALKQENNALFLVGDSTINFVGSLTQKIFGNSLEGEVLKINLELEKTLWEFLENAIIKQLVVSSKNLGKGGLSIGLSKMAFLGNKGVKIEVKDNAQLFSENTSAVILEVSKEKQAEFLALAKNYAIETLFLGQVVSKEQGLMFQTPNNKVSLSFKLAKALYNSGF
ncbi:phosphoribosylformylglycinamidine synthase subunit PurL [Helicobacter cetorum]|uniref:Phosphoribosylformylglycinamidine synthase subunit PurL n=1 Tax=Helicobacter cetorum (strain ATCC BAA-429 / MIT 00-7128) TaxID=182217 RepID=I0EMJ7_HELC0|nr:phosphoribosylformylglycinamidine synthase subunit PurL [Helicobacter cetorum]AFI04166.1 phosphoribosylformylglycinamidine synthase II [Helicobacter cetorum MIT 00-7128]